MNTDNFLFPNIFALLLLFVSIFLSCGFETNNTDKAVFSDGGSDILPDSENGDDDQNSEKEKSDIVDIEPKDDDLRLAGVNFGPYINDAPVTETEIALLLDIIEPYTRRIRTYGVNGELSFIPQLAKERGIKTAIGIELTGNKIVDEQEINRLLALLGKGNIELAVVGGEALSRNRVSPAELLEYLARVKETGVATTTNDIWTELIKYPDIIKMCDVVMGNFYPFWEGIHIDGAINAIAVDFNFFRFLVNLISPDKEVIIGETGWPSNGESERLAVPSETNALKFFRGFVNWARREKVDYFYFEAFDEPWKIDDEGPCGPHWGVWNSDGEIKPGRSQVFEK